MKGTKKISILVMLVVVFAFATVTVMADPIGNGDFTIESSETRDTASAFQIDAIAGNITELTLDALGVTTFWQGYYGNVTGSIVLANSNNDTMYDWSVSAASGEVYASTG